MRVKGLRWNRSERDLRPRDNANDEPPVVRHSHHVARNEDSIDGVEEAAQRAVSVDAARSLDAGSVKVHAMQAFVDSSESLAHSAPLDSRSSSRIPKSRFRRHASDTQLATRAREHAGKEVIPPVPAVPTTAPTAPAIITTAPTFHLDAGQPDRPLSRKRSKFHPFKRQTQDEVPRNKTSLEILPKSKPKKVGDRKSRFGGFGKSSRDPAEELRRLAESRTENRPETALGSIGSDGKGGSSLGLTLPRPSESRSEADSGYGNDEEVASSKAAQPAQPAQNRASRAFTTWFPRKPKSRNSLFPLPQELAPSQLPRTTPPSAPSTPRPSTSARSYVTADGSPQHPHLSPSRRELRTALLLSGTNSAAAAATSTATAVSFAPGAPGLIRTNSTGSRHSTRSSPPQALPMVARPLRERSSTFGSASGRSDEVPPTPPFANGSGRNSTSTAGRSSFSNIFTLSHRFRHSDPHSPRQTSTSGLSTTPAFNSQSNSLHLSREAVLPEREEGETAIQYLSRVEHMVHRSQIPSILSKKGDDFLYTVMRSFMRKFAYFGDPLDMAIRKLLMEIDLPKETQQIDRVLQSFADRYHECNPGIFASSDKAYFIAFSILILQTDFFNKNNKRKMTKQDYVKNSSIEGVSDDVLECFYDNIVYTPFIRVEDDMDPLTVRTRKTNRKTAKAAKAAKAAIKNAPLDPKKAKPSKEPLDPYTLIFESKLETLRPHLKEVLLLEDPYTYLGTAKAFDKRLLRHSKVGIIQIESARSRPDAFMSPSGIENPEEARVGLVDLPVDKVGVLWRKDPKKKTARSPWQEWGAVLTGAGLYFFRNANWVKSYTHQYEHHLKQGYGASMCYFKPPVTQFKPDYMLPTDHGVALQDTTYKRHKNAFVFFRHNGVEELFLADSEGELNEWLAKLNHQSTFKTAGIRHRGLIGGHYDGQRQRALRRLDSSNSAAQTVQSPTGEVTIQSGRIDHQLAQQIIAARREQIEQTITESEEKLETSIKELDIQLRDARHILLLAPIQQKTREQLISSAARIQAKLKWSRIETWRMKCHRDILALDLEEERRDALKRQARIDGQSARSSVISGVHGSPTSSSTVRNRPNGVDRIHSNASTSNSSPATTIQHASQRPGTKSSVETSTTSTFPAPGDEEYSTPPETTPPQSPKARETITSTPTSGQGKSPQSARSKPHPSTSTVTNATSALRASIDSSSPSEYRTPLLPMDSSSQALYARSSTSSHRRSTDAFPDFLDNSEHTGRPRTPITPTSLASELESITTPFSSPGPNVAATAHLSTPEPKPRRGLRRSLRDSRDSDLVSVTRSPIHARGLSTLSKESATSGDEFDSKERKRRHHSGRFKPHLHHRSSSAGAQPHRPPGSSASAAAGDAASNDEATDALGKNPDATGLKRDKARFTVHGKKASVVTFGTDWAKGSPEETLLRKKAASNAGLTPPPPTFALRVAGGDGSAEVHVTTSEKLDSEGSSVVAGKTAKSRLIPSPLVGLDRGAKISTPPASPSLIIPATPTKQPVLLTVAEKRAASVGAQAGEGGRETDVWEENGKGKGRAVSESRAAVRGKDGEARNEQGGSTG